MVQHKNLRIQRFTGFTLVEISVVLVILGLLVGGILLSQELLRASKIQTVMTDVTRYQEAIVQFKQKYYVLPGDMANAETYWGTNPNCAILAPGGTGTQTCNGNGNGKINWGSTTNEQFLAWQHLANAGLIPGVYTGATVVGSSIPSQYCLPGVNCPVGKVTENQSYYIFYARGPISSTANWWDEVADHRLFVGTTKTTGSFPGWPLLTTAEAYNLDNKIDDGLPAKGRWKSLESGNQGYIPHCVVTKGTNNMPPDGTLASQADSVYNTLNYKPPACSFEINLGF